MLLPYAVGSCVFEEEREGECFFIFIFFLGFQDEFQSQNLENEHVEHNYALVLGVCVPKPTVLPNL